MSFKILSSAFHEGETIPVEFTQTGNNVSPPLSWADLPRGTKELALVCVDPDAPKPQPFIHWIVYNIPPTLSGLHEALPASAKIDEACGIRQGRNSMGHVGYDGPLPPPGDGPHHYHFHLYALGTEVEIEDGAPQEKILECLAPHIRGQAELIGLFERRS